MGWRTIVIDSRCKIAFNSNYLVIKKEKDQLIHIAEIDVLMIATTEINITGVAINELVKNKIVVIFCDEKYNPLCELNSLYGCHNTFKKINKQLNWKDKDKKNNI